MSLGEAPARVCLKWVTYCHPPTRSDGGAQPSIGARTEREMGDGHESKNGEPSGREYTRYMYM